MEKKIRNSQAQVNKHSTMKISEEMFRLTCCGMFTDSHLIISLLFY